MVEFSVVHSVTTEMCTGFLTLASIGIIVKFFADGYMKHLFGKVKFFDKVATVSSRYSEPAAYFALGAGIIMTFVSMVTGILSWPVERLLNSNLAHNKVLLTITSQSLFIGVFILRTKHTYEIWLNRTTSWLYFLISMAAFTFIILQNSIAGHMVGKGSLIDGIFPWLVEMEFEIWAFPIWVSIIFIIATIVVVALVIILTRHKGEKEPKPFGG